MMDSVDLAILVDGGTMPRWTAEAISEANSRTSASVELVVNNVSTNETAFGKFRTAVKNPFWASVYFTHEFVHGGTTGQRLRQSVPVSQLEPVDGAEWVECEPVRTKRRGNELPNRAVECIVSEADVALRTGFGILVGDALSAPEYGVWSFHHGDLTEYRGRPPGFWEFVRDEDRAGVTLQQLTETLDGGKIIAQEPVDIEDARTWWDIETKLFKRSTEMLANSIIRLENGELSLRTAEQLGELTSVPGLAASLRYYSRTVREVLG